MKVLWTPWRYEYIKSFEKKNSKENNECIFCKISKESTDDENYIVVRKRKVFVVLNIYPYNTGHLMIVPYRHVASIEDLTQEELQELAETIKLMVQALRKTYSPHGFNIGANIGRDAGAGIDQHFHVHVLPRWRGDTNFMPIIAGTKVIPETLDTTLKKIRQTLKELERG